MADPIIEQIALKIVELLEGITIANGFRQDLTIKRPKRIHLESDLAADNTVMVQQDASERMADDQDSEDIYWKQTFALDVYLIDSDDATTSLDIRINNVRSDIEKKLCAAANIYLGGLAEIIYPEGSERFNAFGEDASFAGITLNYSVQYKTAFGDPDTQN